MRLEVILNMWVVVVAVGLVAAGSHGARGGNTGSSSRAEAGRGRRDGRGAVASEAVWIIGGQEGLTGNRVVGIEGLSEAAVDGLAGLIEHQRGHEERGRVVVVAAIVVVTAAVVDPCAVEQAFHGQSLFDVNSEKAFGYRLGSGGDILPGVAVHAKVAVLDPPDDGSNRVVVGVGIVVLATAGGRLGMVVIVMTMVMAEEG